ncbi:hypothetical protein ACHAWU_005806 [Discostella pseudostelligera]|uniref:Uncharacterized protein n=1 Tax=Discostella pseudostelligera TaxID=259834 RepID=A0ABD3MFB1_9STRA
MPRISSSREHRRRSSCDGSMNRRRRAALIQSSFGSQMCTRQSMDSTSSTQSSWDSLRNYLFSYQEPTKQPSSSNPNDQDSFSRPPSLVNSETSVQTTSSESSPPRPLTALDRYYALQRASLAHHAFQRSSLPHQLNLPSQSYAYGSSMPQKPISSSYPSLSGTGASFLPQTHCEEESWGQFVDEIEPDEIPSFNYRRYQAILNRTGRAYYR